MAEGLSLIDLSLEIETLERRLQGWPDEVTLTTVERVDLEDLRQAAYRLVRVIEALLEEQRS